MITMTKGINIEAVAQLEKYLGEFYVDIVELEWDMSVEEFVTIFWNEDEEYFEV